jgi:hypothetical protein
MKPQTALLFAVALSSFAIACGGSDSPPQATGCTSAAVTNAQQPVACMGASVIADEANNYAFSSEIKLPPVTVKSMSNLTFDWSAVTRDFQFHPLSPTADVDMAVLLLWQLPLATLETRLNADELFQSDLVVSPPPSWPGPNTPTGGMTSTSLYSFTVNGVVVEPAMFDSYFDPVMYPPSGWSYMVAIASGTVLGQGFQMLQTFNLDPASSATTVALKNESTQLTCEVSLRNLTITGVPGGTPALMLDWSQMTTNALGAPFQQGYVTSAIVGHYTETPQQLEGKFLDLDRIATKYYRADIPSGSVLDFTTLRDSNGASFPGVDDTGTWLVGLICGNCRNPAPWYMTILKPCTP